MSAFYNEIDPYAAAWLRNLIAAGHIAPGVVDERSIEDIEPAELARYTQCHFFAGIGAWSYALRLAGWSDDRPVWTGSCPCQPFSSAGKGAGFADERHLWPAFHWLISQCRPPVVFGEQVASKDGLEWLDLVQADLEGTGYASAAADLCAAGIGAPHIRQRLYWVADADCVGRKVALQQHRSGPSADGLRQANVRGGDGSFGRLADNNNKGLEGRRESGRERGTECAAGSSGVVGGLADAELNCRGRKAESPNHVGPQADGPTDQHRGHCGAPAAGASSTHGHWRDADWLFCRDGKWRPVEPGTFPLAHGAPARVGRLRAYGNAIVPQVAQTFIEAYLTHP